MLYVLPGCAKIDVAVACVWSVETVQFICDHRRVRWLVSGLAGADLL